jgi:hypothetical protein
MPLRPQSAVRRYPAWGRRFARLLILKKAILAAIVAETVAAKFHPIRVFQGDSAFQAPVMVVGFEIGF